MKNSLSLDSRDEPDTTTSINQQVLMLVEHMDDDQRMLVGRILAGSLLQRAIRRRLPGAARGAIDFGLATLERPRHPRTGRPYGGRRIVTPTAEGYRCAELAREAIHWHETRGEVQPS
jgi:hypothetical protein